jgi:ATP-dependent exoDNAse (exonuclease V) beta subunit
MHLSQRLHELPCSYESEFGDTVKTGYIDLIYRYNGQWTIVDFKTDNIGSESDAEALIESKEYRKQVEPYGEAVTEFLGERPGLTTCLLNGRNHAITWQPAFEV